MKRKLLSVLCALLILLTGCAPEMKQTEEYKHIYASFFPIYALTGLIIEDIPEISLKCLVQPQDDCLRLYDMSGWDASVLAYDADVVVIGGHGLESFESSLYQFGANGPAVITASPSEELIDQGGMSDSDENTGHLSGINPFLYMSVGGAREMIAVIAPALATLYPEHAEAIAAGYNRADERLADVEKEIAAIREITSGKRVIIMNEALLYTALDYDMSIVYRYDRESGTTLYGESLDSTLREFEGLEADVILIEKQAPAELTAALSAAGYTVVGIDTMNSYPANATPDRYIEVQMSNAEAISAAFSEK